MLSAVRNDIAVGKERCPECAKKGKDTRGDNLHRYEDGHAWCFSCGHREPSDAMRLLHNMMNASENPRMKRSITIYEKCPAGASCMSHDGNECQYCVAFDAQEADEQAMRAARKRVAQNEEIVKRVLLPYDSVKTIPAPALKWLDSYGITRDEIIKNDISYSNNFQRLIFPIRNQQGQLLAWTGRYFGPNNLRKWHHEGDIGTLCHIIGSPLEYNRASAGERPIVIVEDPVSCIKVGRHAPTLVLFGSHLSLKTAVKLRNVGRRVILWLDADKFVESQAISKRLALTGIAASILYTEKDPKAYDDAFIKKEVA